VIAEDDEIFTTLQLRYLPSIFGRKRKKYIEMVMNIKVHRGDWYMRSWKVEKERSGGLLWNIGVHYFDLILNEFPDLECVGLSIYNDKHMSGILRGSNAGVIWNLGVDAPINKQERMIHIGGYETESIDLTGLGFEDLHTKVYQDIMKGKGVRPKDLFGVTKLITEMNDMADRK
jgi:UDP-N-acetyl-2-amino-2-deoxyglucuronate dehydrogenase